MDSSIFKSLLSLAVAACMSACEEHSALESATEVAASSDADPFEASDSKALESLLTGSGHAMHAHENIAGFWGTGDFGIRSICDPDERDDVTSRSGPELATCRLEILFPNPPIPDYRAVGTGFLVTPNLVLTAGHCVYDKRFGGWAEMITVIPAGDDCLGKYAGSRAYTVVGWSKNNKEEYDYGAVVIPDDDLHDTVGFTFDLISPDDPDLKSAQWKLRGYPMSHFPGALVSRSSMKPSTTWPLQFSYLLDASRGQSGGPVFLDNNDSSAAGIHARPGCPNIATRITAFRRDRILSEWRP